MPLFYIYAVCDISFRGIYRESACNFMPYRINLITSCTVHILHKLHFLLLTNITDVMLLALKDDNTTDSSYLCLLF